MFTMLRVFLYIVLQIIKVHVTVILELISILIPDFSENLDLNNLYKIKDLYFYPKTLHFYKENLDLTTRRIAKYLKLQVKDYSQEIKVVRAYNIFGYTILNEEADLNETKLEEIKLVNIDNNLMLSYFLKFIQKFINISTILEFIQLETNEYEIIKKLQNITHVSRVRCLDVKVTINDVYNYYHMTKISDRLYGFRFESEIDQLLLAIQDKTNYQLTVSEQQVIYRMRKFLEAININNRDIDKIINVYDQQNPVDARYHRFVLNNFFKLKLNGRIILENQNIRLFKAFFQLYIYYFAKPLYYIYVSVLMTTSRKFSLRGFSVTIFLIILLRNFVTINFELIFRIIKISLILLI